MRFSNFLPIVFLTTLIFYSSSKAELYFPVTSMEHRFVYELARMTEIKQPACRLKRMVAPYGLNDFSGKSTIFGKMFSAKKMHLGTYAQITEDFNSTKYSHPQKYESIRAGFAANPTSEFSLYGNFLLDEQLAEDPAYKGKKWRGLAGEIESAFLSYSGDSFDLIFGRFGSFWGPSAQSLIFSEHARPMDALMVRYNWGRILFTYQFAKLDQIDNSADVNRWFAGRRLDFKITDDFYAGLFETIIFGGTGRTAELAYLNPLMFFHSFQLNQGIDDNTFLGFDLTCYLNNRHKLFGQLLVDDLQIDDKTRGDNEPNEIGFLLGFHSIDLPGSLELKTEYLRITNRTYNQNLEWNRYTNRGALIGHEFGPDGERMSIITSKWFGYDKKASLSFIYQCKGEGRYDDDWSEPWLEVDNYNEPFPTGIVEKKLLASIGFTGFVKDMLFISAETGFEFVNNFSHIENDNRTIPFFSLRISFLFSTLVNIR